MEIAQMFLDECPGMVRELEVAIANRDQSVIRGAAHSIRGLFANFGVQATCELALRPEMVGALGWPPKSTCA